MAGVNSAGEYNVKPERKHKKEKWCEGAAGIHDGEGYKIDVTEFVTYMREATIDVGKGKGVLPTKKEATTQIKGASEIDAPLSTELIEGMSIEVRDTKRENKHEDREENEK